MQRRKVAIEVAGKEEEEEEEEEASLVAAGQWQWQSQGAHSQSFCAHERTDKLS